MNRDDVVHIGRVATAHGNHDWKARAATAVHHQLVTALQAIDGQLEPAEPVAFERIRTRQIEHDLRTMRSKDHVHRMCKMREIRLITGAILQLDVEVARFLAKRVVSRSMHRESEHVSVAREDRGRSVALMHIAVDDRDPPDAGVTLQNTTRNRHIIEDAVALPAVGEGVVGASCEIGRAPFVNGGVCSRNRCSDRSARALDHLRRPRKPDTPLRFARQRPLLYRLEIFSGMHEPQILPRRLRRLVQLGGLTMPSRSNRSRRPEYLAIGKRCPSGSGKTNVSE